MKKNNKTKPYQAVSNNIYFDGNSYRVRVSIDGVRHSKNFASIKAAYKYRKNLLEA